MNLFHLFALLLAIAVGALHGTDTPRVDSSTLTGKVMCGYQGWFNAEGDGAGRRYNHWSRGGARPTPENVRVDMWPDLSEFPADERFPTDFVHADGSRAEVFSSSRRPTVLRHFEWMREHEIDGVFVQRFVNSLTRGTSLAVNNAVLENCRSARDEQSRRSQPRSLKLSRRSHPPEGPPRRVAHAHEVAALRRRPGSRCPRRCRIPAKEILSPLSPARMPFSGLFTLHLLRSKPRTKAWTDNPWRPR